MINKCDWREVRNAAMIIAIIDVISTAILLIIFVLGSTVMAAFAIIGKPQNATEALDTLTHDVFASSESSDIFREKKNEAQDVGIWLIIMFLSLVDFFISCVFLDGVRSRDVHKCRTWLNTRLLIFGVFKIIVVINIIYEGNWIRVIPDIVYTVYRVTGLIIGYLYLRKMLSFCRSEEDLRVPKIEISECGRNPPSPKIPISANLLSCEPHNKFGVSKHS